MNEQFEIIIKNNNNRFQEIILKNTGNGEYISILPALGARLNAAHLMNGEGLIPVLCELENDTMLTNDQRFNNAKLFPFAGRISGGKYSFMEKEYSLPLNYPEENNACHGFVYDREFTIKTQHVNPMGARIQLEHRSDGSFPGYPFAFTLLISYILTADGRVIVNTEVENNGREAMLFSDGWHPYYCLGESIDDLYLEANIQQKIILDEYKIPAGTTEPVLPEGGKSLIFNNRQFDDVYKLKDSDPVSAMALVCSPLGKKLSIWQSSLDRMYKYLVVYTPPGRKYVAIEPVSSNINSFNNNEDMIVLESGKKWSASFGFHLTDFKNNSSFGQ